MILELKSYKKIHLYLSTFRMVPNCRLFSNQIQLIILLKNKFIYKILTRIIHCILYQKVKLT